MTTEISLLQLLPHCFVIEVAGPDAARYLQARLTNDVRLLENTPAILAAVLNHQGRAEGLFTVAKGSESDQFFLIADGGTSEEVLAALLKFKVADRLDATLRSDLAVAHVAETQRSIDEGYIQIPEPDGRGTRTPAGGTYLLYDRNDEKALIDTLGPPLSADRALALRIKGNRPIFPEEISPKRVFLESGLTHAVSFTKGCYAGQEVIEKVLSYGKLPKTLQAFSTKPGPTPESGEDVLSADGAPAGSVLSASEDENSVLLFALIQTSHLQNELTLSDKRQLEKID